MLHLIWFAGLVIFAVVCAAQTWRHLSSDREDSMDSGMLWNLLMLTALSLAVAVQHEVLVTGMISWWSEVLPERNTGLNLVTAGLLTFAVWLAMLAGVIGAGAAAVEGATLWRKRRRARSLTSTVLERAARTE